MGFVDYGWERFTFFRQPELEDHFGMQETYTK